jgi:hypothetical protein
MQTKKSEKTHFQSMSVRPRFFAKFKVAYSGFGHFINVHFQKVTTYFSQSFWKNNLNKKSVGYLHENTRIICVSRIH